MLAVFDWSYLKFAKLILQYPTMQFLKKWILVPLLAMMEPETWLGSPQQAT